jgi:two-component system nitrogen regulation response regulator NtrX
LRNTVERLLILTDGSEITSDDVDLLTISRARSVDPGRELLALDNFSTFKEEAERAYIVGKLRTNDWNVAETARRIEMPRSNLYKKIEKYGLVRED